MDSLKSKSEINLDVAKMLSGSGHFPCTCHPAYYSCLQLMKFKIKAILGIDYPQQEGEIASSKSNSHGYTIKKIKEHIQKKEGRGAARSFSNDIKDLKEIRERADYKTDVITRDIANAALSKAEMLYTTINTLKP